MTSTWYGFNILPLFSIGRPDTVVNPGMVHIDEFDLDISNQYIDGTKIEANAIKLVKRYFEIFACL